MTPEVAPPPIPEPEVPEVEQKPKEGTLAAHLSEDERTALADCLHDIDARADIELPRRGDMEVQLDDVSAKVIGVLKEHYESQGFYVFVHTNHDPGDPHKSWDLRITVPKGR